MSSEDVVYTHQIPHLQALELDPDFLEYHTSLVQKAVIAIAIKETLKSRDLISKLDILIKSHLRGTVKHRPDIQNKLLYELYDPRRIHMASDMLVNSELLAFLKRMLEFDCRTDVYDGKRRRGGRTQARRKHFVLYGDGEEFLLSWEKS